MYYIFKHFDNKYWRNIEIINKVFIFNNRGNLMKNITELDQMVVDIFKNLSGST